MNELPQRTELVAAVAAAMQLLLDLQEASTPPAAARRLCRAVAGRHPGIEMFLVAEREPTTQSYYFEIFVGSEQLGGVVLGYGPQRNVPFMFRGSVRLGDDLLRVNGVPLTLPEAVQLLDVTHERDFGAQLIGSLVLRQAIEDADDEALDDAELQRALDAFRTVRGLYDADGMRHWMAMRGLTDETLASLVAGQVRAERLRSRLTDGAIDQRFFARPSDYDVAVAGIVELRSFEEAEAFVDVAATTPFHALLDEYATTRGARYRIERWRRWQCPPELEPALFCDASSGLRALRLGRCFVVVRRISLQPCLQLDEETRRVIRDRLFDEWLDAQKRSARVEWNGTFDAGETR